MTKFCLICKKDALVESSFCQDHQQHETKFKQINNIEKDFEGVSPPAVFIGSKLDYPKVNVGILTPFDTSNVPSEYNNPNSWVSKNYDIKKIVELRTGLINSRFQTKVYEARDQGRILKVAQEVAMSMNPANLEIHLEKKPQLKNVYFEDTSLPIGPSAKLSSVSLTENVKISTKIERVVSDTDMKAIEGIRSLHSKGYDETQLSQLLSVGVLGQGQRRVLVPTRSSITAIDSNLGEDLILEVKNFDNIDEYKIFFGNYFGNYYLVLLFPEIWGYELTETYIAEKLNDKNTVLDYTTDFEGYKKRTKYAEECAGGYYASRFSVLQYLESIKKQARVLVYRVTTSEYETPLGVWVVRQGLKKTMSTEPIIFENRESMLSKAREIILHKFNFNLDNFLSKSKLLTEIKKQNKLSEFF